MASQWLIIKGNLEENATTHQAVIDATKLAADDSQPTSRPDPNLYNFHIQIKDLGGASSVTVEGLGPGDVWSEIATGKTSLASNNNLIIDTGVWQMIRLTWTGGTPNGAGKAAYAASRKFNGLL